MLAAQAPLPGPTYPTLIKHLCYGNVYLRRQRKSGTLDINLSEGGGMVVQVYITRHPTQTLQILPGLVVMSLRCAFVKKSKQLY